MRFNRSSLVAGLAFAALAFGLVPFASQGELIGLPKAQAQNIGQRAVTGSVVDASSAPVTGAIVFLKSLKTKAIRSYTTTTNGRFRFAQVYMANDYDLWTEKGGMKSATKTVSSWDTRPEFETELKLK